MKTISVVALDPRAAAFYGEQIERLFRDYSKVRAYSVRDGSAAGKLPAADLFVISTDAYGSAEEVARHVPIDSEIMGIEVSYTWDTLSRYREKLAGRELYFVIGTPDFALLHTWHRGLELPRLCQFIVVARGEQTEEPFVQAAHRLWPGTRDVAPVLPGSRCLALAGGGLAHYLPLPWLAVSASRIRERWLRRQNVDFLIPRAVDELLRIRHAEVAEHWKSDGLPC